MSSTPAGKYRMIAIDLDGTLLSPQGKVTDRTRQAVHSCLKAGLLVCFATGRNWTESKTVLDDVEHFSTAVFVGGAMVIDTQREVTLHRTLMDAQLARDLCAMLESTGHAVLALQDTGTAGIDYLITEQVRLNAATEMWMSVTRAAVKRVTDLAGYAHEHTIRVGIVADPRECERINELLVERFGNRLFIQTIRVPAAGVDVLEIFDPSVNKWEGISHVARHHGIEREQIIAIGDDVNDLHMIEHAGLGVAMGNARPEVLKIADRVIGKNDDDGLAEFLESIVAEHLVEPLGEKVRTEEEAA